MPDLNKKVRIPTAPRQVLTISSQVAVGLVGNSVVYPTLLALGVTPVALSTIMLSNHPGHARPAGIAVPAETLARMLERLIELGLLDPDVVVVTGYFANEEQIEAIAPIIARLPKSFYLCDPILGDSHTGLYVAEAIATAIRDRLVPLADGLTPNAFELSWLTGKEIGDIHAARAASRSLAGKSLVVTSIPHGDALTTALFEKGTTLTVTRPKLAPVPHGTGDLLCGLLVGRLAQGDSFAKSLGFAVAATEHIIAASLGTLSLDLASGLSDIAAIEAFAAVHG
ncbi:PfkB family carbohydrate kinase [Taklimakanibacter deserti]|uniref:PfkB family carbohydrate kinase n=1 Tax=Taklimakanibacter deserti TaxID=2267839 RepID=UPI000E65943B